MSAPPADRRPERRRAMRLSAQSPPHEIHRRGTHRDAPPLPPVRRATRDQCAGQHRPRQRLLRRRGQHQPGNHGAAVGVQPPTAPATRRSRSITRARSSPARSRSICAGQVARATPTRAIDQAMRRIGVPATIHGSFQGTAQVFQQSLANEPILIAAALVAVYIVLGVLYESYIHPHHDPVDPALGRRRRGAGADAVQHRVQHHRADRRHPADRHRQEERHHDDRLRARRRAHARASTPREAIYRPACCASGRS